MHAGRGLWCGGDCGGAATAPPTVHTTRPALEIRYITHATVAVSCSWSCGNREAPRDAIESASVTCNTLMLCYIEYMCSRIPKYDNVHAVLFIITRGDGGRASGIVCGMCQCAMFFVGEGSPQHSDLLRDWNAMRNGISHADDFANEV